MGKSARNCHRRDLNNPPNLGVSKSPIFKKRWVEIIKPAESSAQ